MAKRKIKKKGAPVCLSIADDIQTIGYKMAFADRLTGLTALVEKLLIQEAKRRGIEIK
jgi:hypothetical protein